MKVSIDGGVPVTLCDAALPFGASWGPDNSIVFSPDEDSGLFRVSAEGGEPESLTTPDKTKEEYSHRLPHCLPDGKGVLFTIMREHFDPQPRIAWLDLKTRKWRVLMEDAADARYVPTGHLVFLRQGTLMVVPFDLGRHEVTGQPVPAIANVMQALNVTSTLQHCCRPVQHLGFRLAGLCRGRDPPGHAELTRLGGSERKSRTDCVIQSSVFSLHAFRPMGSGSPTQLLEENSRCGCMTSIGAQPVG